MEKYKIRIKVCSLKLSKTIFTDLKKKELKSIIPINLYTLRSNKWREKQKIKPNYWHGTKKMHEATSTKSRAACWQLNSQTTIRLHNWCDHFWACVCAWVCQFYAYIEWQATFPIYSFFFSFLNKIIFLTYKRHLATLMTTAQWLFLVCLCCSTQR